MASLGTRSGVARARPFRRLQGGAGEKTHRGAISPVPEVRTSGFSARLEQPAQPRPEGRGRFWQLSAPSGKKLCAAVSGPTPGRPRQGRRGPFLAYSLCASVAPRKLTKLVRRHAAGERSRSSGQRAEEGTVPDRRPAAFVSRGCFAPGMLLVSLVACGPGESVDPYLTRWFRPCSTDEECAAEPTFADRGPFPPLCIAGMCQVTESHRCDTDDDCADVGEPPGATRPPRCGTVFGGDPRLCDAAWSDALDCWWDGQPTCYFTTCHDSAPCAPVGADPSGFVCRGDGVYPYKITLCLPLPDGGSDG